MIFIHATIVLAAACFAAAEPASLSTAPPQAAEQGVKAKRSGPQGEAPGARGGEGRLEPDDLAAVAALEKARARLVRGHRGAVLNVEISGSPVAGAGSDDPVSHLKGLRSLESLKIEHRPISEAGLASIGGLTRLKRLYFNDVNVSDEGLRKLGKLADLEVLSLEKSEIAGSGLAHLKGLAKLRVLNLGQCTIADGALAHLEALGSLETLALHRTTVTDAGMAHLARLPKLCVVNLNGCAVTGACFEHFRGLSNLRILRMRDCKITEENVEKAKKATPGLAIFRQ